MNPIDSIHGQYVFTRRIRVLSDHIAKLIPQHARLLDVGCGDGTLTKRLCELRPDITAEGVDVLVRPQTAIPVTKFDGHKLPFADDSFDCVLFVDVLHHTEDPTIMLREAARVTKNCIVLKDHTQEGLLAHFTLRFMDYVGNARHGVVLPYNYWTRAQWTAAYAQLNLKIETELRSLNLYPAPASWFFDRELHFIAALRRV
jgi:ubiquinone/menaquinone biosynthesis C-methylase UbiE